eukprot:SAG31_NODE_4457_length_3215_cov_1.790757_3_plen_52_part_00
MKGSAFPAEAAASTEKRGGLRAPGPKAPAGAAWMSTAVQPCTRYAVRGPKV